jgi:hypothetical protein
MKLSANLFLVSAVTGLKVKTLLERPDEDRTVPHRHPLQRLWRLYQFSEEIIQTHFYESEMRPEKLDKLRGRIGKWLYLAQRQSFLRATKRCGFYNANLPHGGPMSGSTSNEASHIPNEQTALNNPSANTDVIPDQLDIYNPRPNRKRRNDELDTDFCDGDFCPDSDRYNREDPCIGIKQIMTGFRKWALRYIGNCGGQANFSHQVNRSQKFYAIFRDGLNCPAN